MEKLADIVKLAIANEVNAKVFYEQAADLARQGESTMVFMELVGMEASHAQRLVDAFGELLRQEGVDAAAHLARLEADAGKTLDAAQTRLLRDADPRQVIEHAIGMEAAARDAYLRLAERVEQEGLRRLCRDLADEERRHGEQLAAARTSIDMPQEDRPAL